MQKNKEQLRGITDAAPLKDGSLPGAAQKDKDKKQEKQGGRERGGETSPELSIDSAVF